MEYVDSVARLAELRDRYGLANAVDVGQGVFGVNTGLLFVDDDNDGQPIAYAPPEISRKCHAVEGAARLALGRTSVPGRILS